MENDGKIPLIYFFLFLVSKKKERKNIKKIKNINKINTPMLFIFFLFISLTQSNYCGDLCSIEINENELIIDGEEIEMIEIQNKKEITTITFSQNIEKIKEYSFYGFINVKQ